MNENESSLHFFSTDGRLGRVTYISYLIIAIVLGFLFEISPLPIIKQNKFLLEFLVGSIFYFPDIKRLKDLNASIDLIKTYQSAFSGYFGLFLFVYITKGNDGFDEFGFIQGPRFLEIIYVICFIAMLLFTIAFIFVPGTKKNKWGERKSNYLR